MNVRRINGTQFHQMMDGALHRILAEEQELNALNVFPVADGDTGTNMRLTVQNAMRITPDNVKLCLYLKELSRNMLLSARGNSGVILSQLFKGMYLELARCTAATTEDLRNAFIRAYKVAYDAVTTPVEGTILTVAREGIEGVKSYVTRNMPPDRMMIMYLSEMSRVLERTPEILPVLRESGVVDSGGKGWICLVSGMLEALTGETPPGFVMPQPETPSLNFELFNEDSVFEDGYCTEFILQRMKNHAPVSDFDFGLFTGELEKMGTSVVAVEEGSRVKVHIHAVDPTPVIDLARRYGEFLTFKLENMQLQHSRKDAEKAADRGNSEESGVSGEETDDGRDAMPRTEFAVIAVGAGEEFAEIYRGQGCTDVLDGGPTMSVSAREFLDAVKRVNADHAVLLPNSANVILAAEQAKKLWTDRNTTIHVIPTRSAAEGYFALSMDNPDEKDPVRRAARMEEGAQGVTTITFARAAKAFSHDGKTWNAGERIAFINGTPAFSGEEMETLLREALQAVPDLPDREICAAFRGLQADGEDDETVEEIVSEVLPMADFAILNGGMTAIEWEFGLY